MNVAEARTIVEGAQAKFAPSTIVRAFALVA